MRVTALPIILLCAAAPGPGAQAQPSFDCTRAANPVENLLCSDQQPAALDRELARLYGLALAEPSLDTAGRDILRASQRGWIKGRDECWKADDLRGCVVSEYATRIAELRQGYPNARAQDDQGISLGPYAFTCDGLEFGIDAGFVNADPSLVVLSYPGTKVTIAQQISASGARYEGDVRGAHYLFWTKGSEARVELPGREATICRTDEIG